MLRGSCCCGAVKFTLSSPPTMMGTCHCSRCRKVGASAIVFVERDAFELVSGADAIATYTPEAPYKFKRCFCSRCGTSLGEVTSRNESFPIPANCFDDDLGIANRFHVFVKEKPDWYTLCDDAPQFAKFPQD